MRFLGHGPRREPGRSEGLRAPASGPHVLASPHEHALEDPRFEQLVARARDALRALARVARSERASHQAHRPGTTAFQVKLPVDGVVGICRAFAIDSRVARTARHSRGPAAPMRASARLHPVALAPHVPEDSEDLRRRVDALVLERAVAYESMTASMRASTAPRRSEVGKSSSDRARGIARTPSSAVRSSGAARVQRKERSTSPARSPRRERIDENLLRRQAPWPDSSRELPGSDRAGAATLVTAAGAGGALGCAAFRESGPAAAKVESA
jgi:hypothetical protein